MTVAVTPEITLEKFLSGRDNYQKYFLKSFADYQKKHNFVPEEEVDSRAFSLKTAYGYNHKKIHNMMEDAEDDDLIEKIIKHKKENNVAEVGDDIYFKGGEIFYRMRADFFEITSKIEVKKSELWVP